MKEQRVPILVYHHVYPEDSPELAQAISEGGAGIIGETAFRRQIKYITEQGWTVVSTNRVVDWLTSGAELPPKAAVLHFDNGWLDTATTALPILQQFGLAATCFPITDGIESAGSDSSIVVRTLTEGATSKPFMDWDQIGMLVEAGWQIGAHTATHCKAADKLAAEGEESILEEVETSNSLFEKNLGFVPDHFAYPSGSRNEDTDALLSRFYRSLRRWQFEWPIRWTFTDNNTSALAMECQNIDLRVQSEDFERIFEIIATQ